MSKTAREGKDDLAPLACPNPDCSRFNQFNAGNLSVAERMGKNKAIRRLYCNHCQHRFSERQGSLRQYTKLPGPRAQGYAATNTGPKVSRKDTRTFGDEQVLTSAMDLIQWDHALRGNTLVKAETLRRAFTAGRLTDGKPSPYGFGWFVGRDAAGAFDAHGGGWAGTSTYVLRFLDNGLTIVVLSNLEKFPAKEIATETGTWFQ